MEAAKIDVALGLAMNEWLMLACFVLVCVMVASSGAVFRPGRWYDDLHKPSWTPPKWLFAPAWTVLYLMIAVAGWTIWRKIGFSPASLVPFACYAIQLAFNAGWSAVFFGLRRIRLAFAEVTLLWLSIAATIVSFSSISLLAAGLLLPYLAWVTFAAAVNLTICRLNPRSA